jgi:hypothetical protein
MIVVLLFLLVTDGPQEGRKSQVIVLQSSSRYHVGEDVDTERQEYNTQELNAGNKGEEKM